MAKVVQVPIKIFPDGSKWLLLDSILGARVILRAHEIDMKQNVEDYDKHHCPVAHAKSSVKCKSKAYDITDKVLEL